VIKAINIAALSSNSENTLIFVAFLLTNKVKQGGQWGGGNGASRAATYLAAIFCAKLHRHELRKLFLKTFFPLSTPHTSLHCFLYLREKHFTF
jgi:hypothetical protein